MVHLLRPVMDEVKISSHLSDVFLVSSTFSVNTGA